VLVSAFAGCHRSHPAGSLRLAFSLRSNRRKELYRRVCAGGVLAGTERGRKSAWAGRPRQHARRVCSPEFCFHAFHGSGRARTSSARHERPRAIPARDGPHARRSLSAPRTVGSIMRKTAGCRPSTCLARARSAGRGSGDRLVAACSDFRRGAIPAKSRRGRFAFNLPSGDLLCRA